MAAYYYANYFKVPLNQSPRNLVSSEHPFGIPSDGLSMSPAKPQEHNVIIERKVDEQEKSIFFRLPAEIRNQIYEELLCVGTVGIKYLAKHGYQHHDVMPPHPAILATCRKAHEEAVDLLYTTHIFYAHPSLLSSLPHLTSSARPVLYPTVLCKIKRWQLTLRLDTDPRFTTAQATAAFSGAEFLDIRVWQSMYDGADCSVLKLFVGVRGVKIARVGGSATPELAKWLEERMMTEKEEDDDLCTCANESGIVRCGDCRKKVETDGVNRWFSERNAWQFGNR
jgi:hypothetical protein